LGYETTVFALFDDSGFDEPTVFFGLTKTCITDELLVFMVIVSGLIFAFSKERHEDEMVASIRLQSLAIATIANYLIILFCYTFIFGFLFFNVMMAAMVSQLLIFIILFRFKMYRFYNSRQDEE
jgi:amino acid transporter